MRHESCLFVSTKTKQEVENLLSIENIENIEEGQQFDFIQIGTYTYDNGVTLYVDLCSGSTNYFLQYELVDRDHNVVDSDTFDELEDFEIEDSSNVYVVHFDLYEEEE